MYLFTLQIRNFRNYRAKIFRVIKVINTIYRREYAEKTNALTALIFILDYSYYYTNKILKK